ncbi:putative threonyl-trna synthetase protein [Zalerion maritima]|uniref:threonine--tRNA ligase n=1 Tax=Zalerion maritima TaxID=339359 RepID=A0AAD5RRY8_9PEZI|nr:putative threonyl-trna synthetase protein [Zalerion maritima]
MLRPRIGRQILSLTSQFRASHPILSPQWHRQSCVSCASESASEAASPPSPSTPAAKASTPLVDHRLLGAQQGLFTMSIYSPGSPIFLPAGTLVFNRLVAFLRRQYVHYGFEEVLTPTMYKKALWGKSGHLENYGDDMFTVTSLSPARAEDEARVAAAAETNEVGQEGVLGHGNHEKEMTETGTKGQEAEYGLKPMNCPGHCLIFGSTVRSYRQLPVRYADFSALHRNEISGALSGLTRVRRFHQDDGHIFCRPSQVEEEIRKSLDFVRVAYEALRLGPFRLVLSTCPKDHFIGTKEEWERAEGALARALDHVIGEGKWERNPGDGAFYGPKIDIILTDKNGKEHQTATIQLDFQLPKRFGLSYSAPAPEKEARGEVSTDPEELATVGDVTPVMVHRAVLGSVERLLALLMDQTEGKWPLWLNPKQVVVVTVNDSPEVTAWANEVRRVMLGLPSPKSEESETEKGNTETLERAIRPSEETGLTVDVDTSARTVNLKVREAKAKTYGVIVVVGKKDVENGTVMVDATGIPEKEGQDRNGWAKKQMNPRDLLKFVKKRVDRYE